MLSSYSSYGVHPVELTLFIFFLMIRRPPRSTLFSLHDALPIFVLDDDVADDPSPVDGKCAHRLARKPDRKSTRLTSSHEWMSYAAFCLKKKKNCRAAFSSSGGASLPWLDANTIWPRIRSVRARWNSSSGPASAVASSPSAALNAP